MNYRAIIFDMDGTITRTKHLWDRAVEQLLAKRGITIDVILADKLEHLAGLHMEESCKFLKEVARLEDDIDAIYKEKMELVKQLYEEKIEFIEGFDEFHRATQKHKLRTGLATNADDHTFKVTVDRLNLDAYFGKHMYNISYVDRVGKPHPAIYLHTAKQLGIDPRDCIVVEDSAHGIQAAINAGMLCIGLNSSGNPDQTRNAHIIVNHYNEIDLNTLLYTR